MNLVWQPSFEKFREEADRRRTNGLRVEAITIVTTEDDMVYVRDTKVGLLLPRFSLTRFLDDREQVTQETLRLLNFNGHTAPPHTAAYLELEGMPGKRAFVGAFAVEFDVEAGELTPQISNHRWLSLDTDTIGGLSQNGSSQEDMDISQQVFNYYAERYTELV